MARPTKEEREEIKRKADARMRKLGVPEDVIAKGEDPDSFVELHENNDGELAIALGNIRRAMESKGWSYERAARHFGIRGHPYFKDYWPETRWWGDTRWARERAGLPVE